MDYKTTLLDKTVELSDNVLPEIQGLYFGVIGHEISVFDYTRYLEENELPPVDYKVFMRTNKVYIENLAKSNNHKLSELFFKNTDGHILISSDLVFLCLAFVNPELLAYFNALISEAISEGVTYSSGFVYSMAASRLPSDVLLDIIKEREKETNEEQ